MQILVNLKIQVLALHFPWESSKTATCINWFTAGSQEWRCYKSVPWFFCVVLKFGTVNTIHLISLTFHRSSEKKASTSKCWNLALVLTDVFQGHPCSQDLWTLGKTLLLDQITSQESGDPLKAFTACVTTSFCGSFLLRTYLKLYLLPMDKRLLRMKTTQRKKNREIEGKNRLIFHNIMWI